MSGQSSAQSSEERVIENLVPKHVPIKIRIKEDKERALKDLNNDKWTSDFELVVTNTSDKPIYLLEFVGRNAGNIRWERPPSGIFSEVRTS